jgi:hypothetical protein
MKIILIHRNTMNTLKLSGALLFEQPAFLSSGVSAILSSRIVSAPLRYFGIAFGIITLGMWCAAVFAASSIFPLIGMGGTERWIAYPIMLWATGLGGLFDEHNYTVSYTTNLAGIPTKKAFG